MFREFYIKTDIGSLVGYDFHVENPEYVMVLIHGIGEHMGRYKRMVAYLGEKKIAVVGMDLRGHGASIGTRGNCQPRKLVLDDVDQLIEHTDKIYPDVPKILYGHSMGGNIVLDYRRRGSYNGQMAGYIISSPWIELVKKIPKALYYAVKGSAKVLPDNTTMSTSIDSSVLGNKELVGSYGSDPLVHTSISLKTAVDGFDVGIALENGTLGGNDAADEIRILMMHGKEDRLCSIEGFRKVAARMDRDYAKVVEWPGLRHEIHNGGTESKGDEVLYEIYDFISDLKNPIPKRSRGKQQVSKETLDWIK